MQTRLLPLLLLCGCAADPTAWYANGYGPKAYEWIVASPTAIQTVCRMSNPKSWTMHACAFWDDDRCVIVAQTPEGQTPEWIAVHERRHCAGWAHQ